MEERHHLFMFLLGSLLLPPEVTAGPLDVKSPSSPLCLSESCVTTAADLLRQMDKNALCSMTWTLVAPLHINFFFLQAILPEAVSLFRTH